MTLIEFKAWFDGFTENMAGPPNVTQWERIQERVKEIDNKPVTERIYLDRYWHHYYPHYGTPYGIYGNPSYITCGAGTVQQAQLNTQQAFTQAFNSTSAMYAAGKAESFTVSAAELGLVAPSE
jgi:hypothetical protein